MLLLCSQSITRIMRRAHNLLKHVPELDCGGGADLIPSTSKSSSTVGGFWVIAVPFSLDSHGEELTVAVVLVSHGSLAKVTYRLEVNDMQLHTRAVTYNHINTCVGCIYMQIFFFFFFCIYLQCSSLRSQKCHNTKSRYVFKCTLQQFGVASRHASFEKQCYM